MLSPAVVWSICCFGWPYARLSSISAAFKLPSTAICRRRARIASNAVLPFFSSANSCVMASRMSGIFGRPFGLPDLPLTNGLRLAVRSVFFTVLPLFGHLFNVFRPCFVAFHLLFAYRVPLRRVVEVQQHRTVCHAALQEIVFGFIRLRLRYWHIM